MKKTGLMSALAAAKPPVEAPAKRSSKRSNPRFTQICVLVERDAYFEVRRRLIGGEMDASDLINSLLHDWLKKGK